MDDRRIADYFVVAGLPKNPVLLEESIFSDSGHLKSSDSKAPITDLGTFIIINIARNQIIFAVYNSKHIANVHWLFIVDKFVNLFIKLQVFSFQGVLDLLLK